MQTEISSFGCAQKRVNVRAGTGSGHNDLDTQHSTRLEKEIATVLPAGSWASDMACPSETNRVNVISRMTKQDLEALLSWHLIGRRKEGRHRL